MTKPLFLFRVDADAAIGLGHLSRCLTLAQAVQALGGEAVFAMTSPAPAVAAKVEAAGAGLLTLPVGMNLPRDLAATLNLTSDTGAAGVVLDGYKFDQAYLDGLARTACCLFFDELMAFRFHVALVLNQNLYARVEDYRRGDRTKLLLGPAYAVLREEFVRARPAVGCSQPDVAARLLLNFGGSDPTDLTSRALAGLADARGRYQIKVVLGGANPHGDRVRALAAASPHRVEVLTDISNMAQVMNWADLALSASGTTTLEMCCLGLPAVLVIQVDNQRLIGEAMAARDLGLQLGWWEEVSAEMMAQGVDELAADRSCRERFSRDGMEAVDGLGADRVARELMSAAREWRP